MTRTLLTAGLVLVWLALVALMFRSRRKRRRAQVTLPKAPQLLGDDLAPPLSGTCLGTTKAGEWLVRVAVRGLPDRAAVTARLTPEGVAVAGLLIPSKQVRDVRLDDAHGGKVAGPGGVLVVTWESAGRLLETGFRTVDADVRNAWAAALAPEKHELVLPLARVALTGRARPPAMLVLEDGRAFRGEAYGAVGETFGEAVFNTGMTGYQETLTDPSYHRQVVVMTAPHIGNTGVNAHDAESHRIWVSGYVVRDAARIASSWRAEQGLEAALREQGVVGITGVDTRAVTRHLRDRGAMRCAVSSNGDDVDAVLARVLASPRMEGRDLAREVTTDRPYVVPAVGETRFRVAALDLGMKRSIPAYLAHQGCEVHVLPAIATADDLLAVDPHGIFLSNGPGDPAVTGYAVDALRGVLGQRPVFGICLGHQILGRALGLGTYKLRFGHRGVNQPVQDLDTGRVAITSHNHGFAVAPPTGEDRSYATPFGRVQASHVDLNDGVVEGLRCLDVPAFSVQYHPEAAPGPHDATGLFAAFADLMHSPEGARA